jgi:hypothetical protein
MSASLARYAERDPIERQKSQLAVTRVRPQYPTTSTSLAVCLGLPLFSALTTLRTDVSARFVLVNELYTLAQIPWPLPTQAHHNRGNLCLLRPRLAPASGSSQQL